MFRQVLYTQWKWAALLVTGLAAGALALPMVSVGSGPADAFGMLQNLQMWGAAYPVLAALTGLLLGLSAWAADHRAHHVYALALPIPRWHYVLLRFGAGAMLVLPVAFGLWLGALIATAGTVVPAGLHAYPHALAARFLLCALLSYSMVFAVAAGTNRTAGWVLSGLFGLLLAQILIAVVGANIDVIGTVGLWMVNSPGPFELFTEPWLLISV